jgi:putative FmdB family regulatory protein
MPIFDYKCRHCSHEELNHLVKKHDEEVMCKKCKKQMSQKISRPNLGRMDNLGRSI